MKARLRGLIADVMGVDETELPEPLTAENLSAWDSLRHFELMLALETDFGVRVPADAMPSLTSEEAIVAYLASATPPGVT